MPPNVVFRCCARVAAEERVLAEAHLTPELIDSFKEAFRGVDLLAYVKREELEQIGCLEAFAPGGQRHERAARDSRTGQ